MARRGGYLRKTIYLLITAAVIYFGVTIIRKDPQDKINKIIFPDNIKVMTYNIHRGVGTDGVYSLARIIRIIREASPHLVCLNEVDFKTERSFWDDQARKIAASVGMDFTFARNFQMQGGWYGNAVLSRFPIKFAENKLFEQSEDTEPRGVLHVIIEYRQQDVHLYATHLSPDTNQSHDQLEQLISIVMDWGTDKPILIAGDLNLVPGNRYLSELTYYFRDLGAYLDNNQNTYPSRNPQRRIDYIFCNNWFKPLAVEVINNEKTAVASDHLPFLTNLKLQP